MEATATLIKEESEVKIANFLNFEKAFDWRYNNYRSRRFKKNSEKMTLYWIGIIALNKINKDSQTCAILYANNQAGDLEKDEYKHRDVDGAPLHGFSTVLYDIKPILSALLKAKQNKKKYFNVFLEETVKSNGAHQVSLLCSSPEKGGKLVYGIAADKPWTKLPATQMAQYSQQELHDYLERITLLSNNPYRWLK